MQCQVCAAELGLNAQFCARCGNRVNDIENNSNVCPICKINDKVSKVSAVVEKGKYHIEGTRQTWASDEDGGSWSPASYSETRTSDLARHLAAPVEPQKPHGVSSILAVSIVGFMTMLLFCAAFSLDTIIRSPSYALSNGIICIFMVAAIIILARVLFRLDRKTRKESEERYNIQRPAWIKAIDLWENCYFCERDDIVFEAQTRKWCRREEFRNFLSGSATK